MCRRNAARKKWIQYLFWWLRGKRICDHVCFSRKKNKKNSWPALNVAGNPEWLLQEINALICERFLWRELSKCRLREPFNISLCCQGQKQPVISRQPVIICAAICQSILFELLCLKTALWIDLIKNSKMNDPIWSTQGNIQFVLRPIAVQNQTMMHLR